MSRTDHKAATVAGLAAGFLDGSSSPAEAMDATLAAIDALDDRLGAWQAVYEDQARQGAEAATAAIESGHRIGPFHGIPFALKDIVDVEGMVTTAGSAAMADRVSPSTATIARRLVAAGGVLVGKTKTVEIALGGWGTNQHMGTPWNPWDATTKRTPGGSSSGSAVAVSSGMVPCAVGTDTGGSVRLPAAFCGIVGLKTTEGLLPIDGIVPLSPTLDTPGPLARTVEDAALMFEVLAGRDPVELDRDWREHRGLFSQLDRGIAGLCLATIGRREREGIDAAVLAAFDRSLDLLANLGAEIVEVDPPTPFDSMKEATFAIVTPEAYAQHGVLFEDRDAPLDEHVRSRILPGRDILARDYIAALNQRPADQAEFLRVLDGYDAYLTPTVTTPALPVEGIDESDTPARFTRAGNYLGLCGVSIPMGLDPGGLPHALQILCRSRAEALALRIAAGFEAARGPLGRPPLSV